MKAGREREAHIRATDGMKADWHRAVRATPAQVAVAGALKAVAPATAVVQLPHARQQARVLAHVHIIWTLVRACTHAIV
jgi:hypothetical protein